MAVFPSPCDRKSLGKAEPLAALGEGRSLQPLGGGGIQRYLGFQRLRGRVIQGQ